MYHPKQIRIGQAPDHERGTPWQARGACNTAGWPDLWFPTGETTDEAQGDIAYAKAICGPCPVRQRCADWALDRGEQGVWGGLTDSERRAIIRARRRDRERTAA